MSGLSHITGAVALHGAFSTRRLKKITFVEQRIISNFVLAWKRMLRRLTRCISIFKTVMLYRKHECKWQGRFREGRESVKDDERSGRSQTSHTAENIERFSEAVRKNMLQTTTG
ncbi:hypothetical protein TNCV_3737251 [Trichonephila clavipes]|nr:hypothetical protein TNCV_3737251 [Trichonephila clavipes]